jgi:acyl-CoA reductase-like NAD-dependent aldehyde dehydrogenase
MLLTPDGPPALPLWIHGRAFLTLPPQFFDVHDAISGEVVRRTPLCGTEEAAEAVAAALAAAPGWAAESAAARQKWLFAWGAELKHYRDHFATLIRQESGKEENEAQAEVEEAVAILQNAQEDDAARQSETEPIVLIAWDAQEPLLAAVRLAAPVLRGGSAVILKPSPRAPAAAYALAELSAPIGIPPGVVNLLQGDEATLKALLSCAATNRLHYSGHPDWMRKIDALINPPSTPEESANLA